MKRKELNQKVALITGASSGIGANLALKLATMGCRLILIARNKTALDELAGQIKNIGKEALAISADVSRPEQVLQAVNQSQEHFGQVDLLISNAGQYIRSPIDSLDITAFEKSMAVNFFAALYLVKALIPQMLARHQGHIVLVSSIDGKKGLPLDAPYVCAKYALGGFGDVLRQELHGKGIGVTTVFPGRVDTPMIANLRVPWISAKISSKAVADAIIRGILQNQAEIILPRQTYLLHYLQTLSPRVADWGVRLFHLEGWEN